MFYLWLVQHITSDTQSATNDISTTFIILHIAFKYGNSYTFLFKHGYDFWVHIQVDIFLFT